MSERALRGTRLGATSYETDNGIDLAPRQDVEYGCPNGHRFEIPFAAEADVPPTWECRICGAQSLRVDGVAPEEKPGKPARTHWDMLLERRTVADLEEVLAERLEVLRTGGIGRGIVQSTLVDGKTGTPAAVATATPPKGAPAKTAPTKKSATVKAAPASTSPTAKSTSRPAAKKTTTSTSKTAAAK
jgi:cell division septation protein DedD